MILSSSFNTEGISGMTSAGKTRFDQAFFNKNLDIRAISRVLICGPPNLNLLVPQALSSLGLSKNKIHLVWFIYFNKMSDILTKGRKS